MLTDAGRAEGRAGKGRNVILLKYLEEGGGQESQDNEWEGDREGVWLEEPMKQRLAEFISFTWAHLAYRSLCFYYLHFLTQPFPVSG